MMGGEPSALTLRGVEKRYLTVRALKGIDLSLTAGEIVALIGPNGAGKTTTLNIASTLLCPSRGEVTIAGHIPAEDPRLVRRLVGYMPEQIGVYDDMRAGEYLHFFAAAYGLAPDETSRRVDEGLDSVGLGDLRPAYIGTLSKGNKQRLFFAKTFLHHPLVALLDEPFSGLDPVASDTVRERIRGHAQRGCAVLIASHDLAGLEQIATRVVAIRSGEIVAERSRSSAEGVCVEVTLETDTEAALALLRESLPEAELTQTDPRTLLVRVGSAGDERRILAVLVEAGFGVISFARRELPMRQVFDSTREA